MKVTEEEYREALEKWKKENPDKEYGEISQRAVVEVNGKQIHIGKRICRIRYSLDNLDEDTRKYWESKGVLNNKRTSEQEYREALEIWKKENPGKGYRDIPSKAVVKVNGKEIRIGVRISTMRACVDKLDEDVRRYWESKGVLEWKKSRVTEEEYREALEIWKRENPNKEYSEISQKTIVELNGKRIRIGMRISTMKICMDQLDEDTRRYWEAKGVLDSKRISEEEYREALEIWKKKNPDKEYSDIPLREVIEVNGKSIQIGRRIDTMKANLDQLDEDVRKYWELKGVLESKRSRVTEEEYREALEIWKKENPDKEYRDIPFKAAVVVNGKKIRIGARINTMKRDPSKLDENVRNYWESKGVLAGKRLMATEEEYREALEIWKRENPNKEYREISYKTVVEVNGKRIHIGKRIDNMKRNLDKFDEESRRYWESKGVLEGKKVTEEEYREALEIWKRENPDKEYKDISQKTVVEVNGKQIRIGARINTMKLYLDQLNEDVRKYWESKGVLERKRSSITEEEYREALEIWKRQNPDKEYREIPYKATVMVNGKKIRIGIRINTMKAHINQLDEDVRKYWESKGVLDRKKATEEEYREALEIWKRENPDKEYKDISQKTVVEVNGKQIRIGMRIRNMKASPDKLHEDACKHRELKGVLNGKNGKRVSEQEYRDALEMWKKENPDKEYWEIPVRTVVEINGQKINIGARSKDLKRGKIKLDSDTKKYYEERGIFDSKEKLIERKNTLSTIEKYTNLFHGDSFKASRVVRCLTDLRERRRKSKRKELSVEEILKNFDVDFETLKLYLERTKDKEVKNNSRQKQTPLVYQGKTLKAFCLENGYNYEVISRAIRLHEFCEHDSLEQLINRSLIDYLHHGQKKPATWVYEKYGHLVKHMLLELGLDSNRILQDMSKRVITLEEAIRHQVFLQTRQHREDDWLEELYNYLIEEINVDKDSKQTVDDIVEMYKLLVTEYHLTSEEQQLIYTAFVRYLKTMKEYQILDVGLETDENKKLTKIKDYSLEAEDIEESYFVPLKFDQGVLLGKKSELYQRRQLLRQYIIDWDYYSEQEKQETVIDNNFTVDEINYINTTREQINKMIKKIR